MQAIMAMKILAAGLALGLAATAGAQMRATHPQTYPQTTTAPAQVEQPAAPAPQANAPRKFAAKSKPEYDAFKAADATAKSDPDLSKGEAAAGDFQTKFPQSDLTSILYDTLMKRYQQANQGDKAVAMARRELALDPQSVPALLTVSSIVSAEAHETDLDFSQKYEEVSKDANQAIHLLESGEFVPAGYSPEQINSIKAVAYSSIGNLEFMRAGDERLQAAERTRADAAAEQALRKCVQLSSASPDPGEWLRLAVTLDHESRYSDALAAANQAVTLAAGDAGVLALAQQEQTRLKALAGNAAPGVGNPH